MPEHMTKTRDFYRLGDVVTLQDRVDPMTIESIQDTPFGVVLGCCWFDGHDCLNFSAHPANTLDLFPRNFSEADIRRGTELRLRSRGPVMTVIDIEDLPEGQFATCEWTGPNEKPRQRMFPVHGLVLSMLDQVENFDLDPEFD